MFGSFDRKFSNWLWFAPLLGVLVPVVTSLGISTSISVVYSWVYTSSWGAPTLAELDLAKTVVARIQTLGGWSSYAILLCLAYALSRRTEVPPWRSGLLMACGCWGGTVPFMFAYQPALGVRFVLYLGFDVAVGITGALVGANARAAARRLILVAERVRQASSLQAIVEVMASDAMRGPSSRAVLFEHEPAWLRPVVDSGKQVELFSAVERTDPVLLRHRSGLVRIDPVWLITRLKWPLVVGRSAYGVFVVGREGPGGLLLLVPGKGGSVPRREREAWQAIAEQVALAWHKFVLMDQVREVTRQVERERLSHEIHDGLSQDLISAVLHLEAAEKQLSVGKDAQLTVAKAEAIVRQCLTTARELAWSSWQCGGNRTNDITESITLMAQHWAKQTNVASAVEVVGAPRKLPDVVNELLLGATRESLNNVRKHANATNVRITLTFLPEHLALDVCDNGSGFHVQPDAADHALRGGFGLVALRERVMRQSGQFLIETSEGEGATVSIQLPLRAEPTP